MNGPAPSTEALANLNRFRITIEYDGTAYVGWQRQANGRSIQGAIEEAIAKLTGEAVTIRGAGRTDAGVHALGQVAHFDLIGKPTSRTIRDGLNAHLRGEQIVVVAAEPALAHFDARFSAIGRHYCYSILNRRAPPALNAGRMWHQPRPLDVAAMRAGAALLVGRHDFTTFRSVECQAKSPIRNLDRFEVITNGDEIRVEASARSFLHSQVRSMVGSLVKVGSGSWQPEQIKIALEARDRTACGPLAPPHGLYLVAVDYPA
ncbi:MAG: tRNA pseudouridine(38-40) synthase TruA [Bauldia sp.]